MRRRDFLRAGAASVAGTTAGCTQLSGLIETRPFGVPPMLEDRPARVYYPTHVEGMAMAGIGRSNGYACALAYSYPHRFWLVTGTRTKKVEIGREDTLHLMPTIWHEKTGRRLVDASVSLSIEGDAEGLPDLRPWSMLSQPMGPHFGDNVSLPGDGTYAVTVEMRAPGAELTGSMADAPDAASFEFEFEYRQERRDDLRITEFPEKEGTSGAVAPMEMGATPSAGLPAPEELPGTLVGVGTGGDAVFAAVGLTGADADRFGGDGAYLAVSPRTPYNRYPLAMASLSATVERGGSTAFDGRLTARLDSELGYHYGASIDDVGADDAVSLRVDAPPQVARHEGYETAFVDATTVELAG
jgi:hypothetical protein